MKLSRMRVLLVVALASGVAGLLQVPSAMAQSPAEPGQAPLPSTATVKQLMLDMIHPASNDILMAIFRGGPANDREWAVVRRGAVTLAESGNLLMMRGRARDQKDWLQDSRLLTDAGNAAYKAAQAKDAAALAAVAGSLDASCTTCHKQYRPNVFPQSSRANASQDSNNGGSK